MKEMYESQNDTVSFFKKSLMACGFSKLRIDCMLDDIAIRNGYEFGSKQFCRTLVLFHNGYNVEYLTKDDIKFIEEMQDSKTITKFIHNSHFSAETLTNMYNYGVTTSETYKKFKSSRQKFEK